MITQQAPGLLALKANIARIQQSWQSTVQTVLNDGATQVCSSLSSASPVGTSGNGTNPQGDAPGPLNQSFVNEVLQSTGGAGIVIKTTMPLKLKYNRYGTGLFGPLHHRIFPVYAKALMWEGAVHPYRSIAGMKPNDFVSPIISTAIPDLRLAATTAIHDLLGSL